ncbi:MAG: AMP-binding protein [Acidimicrobiales bacterium]
MLDRALLAPHALDRWAVDTPDGVALEHTDGSRLTFSELRRQSLEFAHALQRLGVAQGTHVGTMLPNVFDAHRTLLAVGWLRGIEVPLNTAHVGATLEYCLNLADVTVLVTTAELAERLRDVAPALTTLHTVVVVDGEPAGPLPWRTLGRAEFLSGAVPAGGLEGPSYSDVAALLFTSGTTGPSKAVVTPWAVVYQFWSFPPAGLIGPGEGLFCALPLFHNSGRAAFNYTLVQGARLIIRERFSAAHLWDDARRTDAKVLALVGPLTSLVYSAPRTAQDADNPVRTVVCGPMIPEMGDFEQRFAVNVLTCYGQTESGIALATGWDHGPWDTCGRPRTDYPWTEVRVVNDRDEPVAPGVVGELVVRSPEPWSLNGGYYKMPAQTAAAWRNGWFHTGDAFRYDEDGWYYFADRLNDTIRRRGENISSYEVETLVNEYPAVVECAAVGVRTVHGDDECLVHVIVTDPGAFDPADLIRFLSPRMPRHMVPRYVEVVDGDLPRNETSMRVRKSVLRDRGLSPQSWDREAPVMTP